MQTKYEKKVGDNVVIKEMIETEITYNKGLTLLKSALDIKSNYENSLLLKQFIDPITRLKEISDKLLLNSQKTINSELSEINHNLLRTQRTQLLKAFFQAYQSYAPLYEQFLKEQKNNPDQFTIIDQYIRKNNTNLLNLEAHLVMPVQRGPRYAMLVHATKDNTEHLETENLIAFEQLHSLIKGCLQHINSTMPSEQRGYQFGDISKSIWEYFTKPSTNELTKETIPETKEYSDSYYLGKYTFQFAKRFILGDEEPSNKVESDLTPKNQKK